MSIDHQRRYESSDDFFSIGGSISMKLTALAAIDVCAAAAGRGYLIARIEGGIWHNPGFEARLDCIWDGANPPVSLETAEENNANAMRFLKEEMKENDVFVITAPSIDGWGDGS